MGIRSRLFLFKIARIFASDTFLIPAKEIVIMESLKKNARNTYYNGYYFRSRLEARWAIWFYWMEIKYHYEIETYKINGFSYLPDFWIPSFNIWIEVKPDMPSLMEIKKAIRVQENTGYQVIFFIGQPWPDECEAVYYQNEKEPFFQDHWWDTSIHDYKVIRAFQKARRARFEFGETPKEQKSFPFIDIEFRK